ALERLDVAEAERLEVRQVEAPDRPRDVSERVGALVAELRRIGKRAGADGIEHDHARASQWTSRGCWWMHGAWEPSQGRTQGACGLASPCATEDAAWRRVPAFQAPPCIPGRPTE